MSDFYFHSNVAEALGNSNKLWYFCRGLDIFGSGHITINIYNCMKDLNISHSTFLRYLKDKRIIRKVVKKTNQQWTIYYRSIINVSLTCKLKDLGAVAWIQVSDLLHWRNLSALLTALKLQQQSLYIARKSEFELKGKSNCRPHLDIDKLFKSLENTNQIQKDLNISSKIPCRFSVWAMLQNNRVFIDADNSLPFGGSHFTIANKISRSTRTIRRRLQNVSKIHQAIGEKSFDGIIEELKFYDSENNTNTNSQFFYFKNSGLIPTTFKHYCNLYEVSYTLVSCKFTRYLLNKFNLEINNKLDSTNEINNKLDSTNEINNKLDNTNEINNKLDINKGINNKLEINNNKLDSTNEINNKLDINKGIKKFKVSKSLGITSLDPTSLDFTGLDPTNFSEPRGNRLGVLLPEAIEYTVYKAQS